MKKTNQTKTKTTHTYKLLNQLCSRIYKMHPYPRALTRLVKVMASGFLQSKYVLGT